MEKRDRDPMSDLELILTIIGLVYWNVIGFIIFLKILVKISNSDTPQASGVKWLILLLFCGVLSWLFLVFILLDVFITNWFFEEDDNEQS